VLRNEHLTFFPADGGSDQDRLPLDEQLTLELWTKRCRTPNDAEIEMLAVYLDVGVWEIFDWCKLGPCSEIYDTC